MKTRYSLILLPLLGLVLYRYTGNELIGGTSSFLLLIIFVFSSQELEKLEIERKQKEKEEEDRHFLARQNERNLALKKQLHRRKLEKRDGYWRDACE